MWGPLARANGAWEVPFFVQCFLCSTDGTAFAILWGVRRKQSRTKWRIRVYFDRKRNILDSLRSASAIKRARWRKIILCAERSMCRWAVVSEPVGRMGRALLISLMALVSAGAQTVEIAPSQLNLVPLTGLGDDRYWQQLVVTLEADDAASDEAVSIELPTGLAIADTDGDSTYADEVRVVYEPSGGEAPGFYATPSTRFDRIVIGSQQAAAAEVRSTSSFPAASAGSHLETSLRTAGLTLPMGQRQTF